jgi:thymidylate synthase
MTIDDTYLDLLDEVAKHGDALVTRNDRVRRIIARQFSFDSTPLISVRKTAWKNALREWEWFMSGSCQLSNLHPAVREWWMPWANHEGNVRFNYSEQFRYFGEADRKRDGYFDQIEYLIEGIKNHPFSRRNVITTWNTQEMTHPDCSITNCHGTVIQAFVHPDKRLDLATYQRSVDVICGLPHNWVQYWAFLLWLAHRTGWQVGSLVWIGGDIHVYDAHKALVEKMLAAEDRPETPQLVYTPTSKDFKADDFTLNREYQPVLTDRAEMVV